MKLTASKLKQIYGGEAKKEGARLESLAAFFASRFGREPERLYRAPGRIEIGGNHTDHQHGCVLAASVTLDAAAAVRRRPDSVIRLGSEGFSLCEAELGDTAMREEEKGTTLGLVRGMAARFALLGADYARGGLDIYVTSRVPTGSGLSSSAAFEVLLGQILNTEYGCGADAETIAKAGQFAENVYFGKPCGLLDQLASAEGGLAAVDFNDPENPLIRRIETDISRFGHELYIVDSGAGHENLTAEYAAIPADCRKISRFFGKEFLRDIEEDAFTAELPALRKACGDRAVLRAMHFFAENRRAQAEARALERGDFDAFLALVRESGHSSALYLQNVIPAGETLHQEMMMTLAVCEKALGGSGAVRVHGGGFGGTALAIVPSDKEASFTGTVERTLGPGSVRRITVCPVGGVLIGGKEDSYHGRFL